MMSSSASMLNGAPLVRPGYALDWYPQRTDRHLPPLERWLARVAGQRGCPKPDFRAFTRFADRIQSRRSALQDADRQIHAAALTALRVSLTADGFTADNVVEGLAFADSCVGKVFGFNLHREQLFCVWLLLHGVIAEMATGEGKSVTAAAAACIVASAGLPVHVITTNDYLVERDAAKMRPLFELFALTSAFVTPEQQDDERRQAYAADICYLSNKQLVFDYLRDRQLFDAGFGGVAGRIRDLLAEGQEQPFLRGLCFAIVDEADSVLIDDAVTPLILSRQVDGPDDFAQKVTAMSLAKRLCADTDFVIDRRSRSVSITEAGEHALAGLASGLEGVFRNRRFRQELVRQALSALFVFERDRDYILRNDEVLLIDQSTGRVMPDRKLQNGLHQMVETKEKCELSGNNETIASLSFQKFFTRYHGLCGMSGTVSEARAELLQTYGLEVVPVPTHRKNLRIGHAPLIGKDLPAQLSAVCEEVRRETAAGRPVLIGTRTVAHSERISESLRAAAIQHKVLNARQDADEAAVVASAGVSGAVTIATNMAGRGTDIPLDAAAREAGGLHVIVAGLNDNGRIDRQLIGRAARQGDPGSYRYILSLDDDVLAQYLPTRLSAWLARPGFLESAVGRRLAFGFCMRAQRYLEKRQHAQRKQVANADRESASRLSFAGVRE